MLSLFFFSLVASANLTEPQPRLSCIDVNVRSTCALSEVTYQSIFYESATFINSCVGLTVLVGEGLWPYKRWSSPKILQGLTTRRFMLFLTKQELVLEGDQTSYGMSEIFCPTEAVDARFVPMLADQLKGQTLLKVGDMFTEAHHTWLIDGLHINRSGYVYATLRDQENGQSIARTLN